MDLNKKTRMKKEERKVQILDSALQVFINKGYHRSTTLDIAKEANISEVTLFRYFNSKKEIFQQAVEPIIMNQFQQTLNSTSSLNSREKLKFILEERLKFISKNHQVIKLILMESQFNSEIAEFDYINKITLIFKDILEKSNLNSDNNLTLRLLVGSFLSYLYLPEIDNDKIENYVNSIIDCLTYKAI